MEVQRLRGPRFLSQMALRAAMMIRRPPINIMMSCDGLQASTYIMNCSINEAKQCT